MDATPNSGNGFDAALKALEDLETGVVTETGPAVSVGFAPSVVAPASSIALSEIEFGDEPAAIPVSPLAEIVAEGHESRPAPPATAEAAAGPAPTAVQPALASPGAAPAGGGKFGKIAVGLAILSSILSAAGLIVAERTIMSAQLVVADARERAHQLEQANRLIRDLEIVRDKQIELLRQQQLQLASAPVTSAELRHRMDSLQAGLLQRDPMNRVIEAIQSGNAADAARFREFGMKMERVEQALRR